VARPRSTDCDVAVVGGGPAGAAAAITLARAGREVVLVDKAQFPRDKCCGDGLTTGALRHLEELGLDPAEVPSWQRVDACMVVSPSGRTVALPLPDDGLFAAVARRSELDASLLDRARAEGVKVHDGHGVVGVAVASDGQSVTLDVDGLGGVRARYVIAADGMWSPVRKALVADAGGGTSEAGYLGEWHAFRQYFAGVGPRAAEGLWVWFEPDLLPGYFWSFPLPDGRANVGFGVLRGSKRAPEPLGRHLKTLWPELLARPHIAAVLGPGATPEAPHKAWPIPARIEHAVLAAAGGRVLFVGDAARAADPMTGEGIGQALETGIVAAQAIARAGALRPGDAAAAYEAAVRSTLALDNRFAGFLSNRAVAHRKGVRLAVRVVGLSGWTRRMFGRWLFEDEPRAVLATPARWHRAFLGRAGAYRAYGSIRPVGAAPPPR
jgi:geranylgeranyl reductase family protein